MRYRWPILLVFALFIAEFGIAIPNGANSQSNIQEDATSANGGTKISAELTPAAVPTFASDTNLKSAPLTVVSPVGKKKASSGKNVSVVPIPMSASSSPLAGLSTANGEASSTPFPTSPLATPVARNGNYLSTTETLPSLSPAQVPAPVLNFSKKQAMRSVENGLTAVSKPARQATKQSLKWANNPYALPMQSANGRIVFVYGDSAPTITCAPLRVCDIELEPGEMVQGAPHIGDSVRWRISPAVSMENNQAVTHLIIKATAVGLDTNLIIPTDRRTYYLRLVSTRDQYASRVSFEYPENNALAWKNIAQTATKAKQGPLAGLVYGDFPSVSIDRINLNYRTKVVRGRPKFKPTRVLDDGMRTFITMNDSMPVEDAPVLLLIGSDGTEQMVNYRLKGNMFIVDRMLDKAVLISGTGNAQQRIEIVRDNCLTRGLSNRCISKVE